MSLAFLIPGRLLFLIRAPDVVFRFRACFRVVFVAIAGLHTMQHAGIGRHHVSLKAQPGSPHLVCFLENIESGLVLAQQGEAPPHLLHVTDVLRVEASGRLEER